jgi:hypothetical protein
MEVDEALQPYVESLRELLRNPELADVRSVPAMEWLGKRDPLRTLIPYTGNLSVVDQARIANWFETHIAIDKKLRNTWLGLLPLAHTFTLFIGSQLLENPPRKTDVTKLSRQELLEMAWEIQVNGDVKLVWQEVDVERECLTKLEEEMFERSEAARIAGEYQWGLDAGDHQLEDAWNPYDGLPCHWTHADRLEDYDNDEMVSDTSMILDNLNYNEILHYSSFNLAQNLSRYQNRLLTRTQAQNRGHNPSSGGPRKKSNPDSEKKQK